MKKFTSVDEYIKNSDPPATELLISIRTIIKAAAPEATEEISYGMPAYKLDGPLVYFAAFKNHIGFYPTNSGISEFEKALKKYKYSKGAVQFPLNEELPAALITRITKFRVKENRAKTAAKKRS